MDISSSNWGYDWDKLNVETVEAMASDAHEQVTGMLADPDYDFSGGKGERVIRRLTNDLAWACRKYDRGLLARMLERAANEIKERLEAA